jgi:hypothetical protein
MEVLPISFMVLMSWIVMRDSFHLLGGTKNGD